MELIDSHQHFWSVGRGDYGWLLPERTLLYRDYLPEDLKPVLERYSISRCIAVQAAPTVAETEFLLNLCHHHDFIAGVVGWIDLDSDDFIQTYARLRMDPAFIGIRPMLQDLEDDWILRPRVLQNLSVLVDDSFTIDLQARPRHLKHLCTLLERYPKLRAVIDHAAKPFIAKGLVEPWKTELSLLAEHEAVYCKVSGLITEARQNRWVLDDFRPYVEHLVAKFGPSRLMFGSDWPVCLESGQYEDVWRIAHESLPQGLTDDDYDRIFGGCADDFYGCSKNFVVAN